MDSLHAAEFDLGGINADGPDASVSSPSKRTSRGTILRMSNRIEPTTTGAQNLDATKAFHDWTIAKDIQSIAEVDSEHRSSDASAEDYQTAFVEPSYCYLRDKSERYTQSRLQTHESGDGRRNVFWIESHRLPSAHIHAIIYSYEIEFSPKLSCTRPRLTIFNTSWTYLLEHSRHPPARRRLLDHHVRELPCAKYPPVTSGPYSDSNSGLHSQVFGAVALKDWTCRSGAGGFVSTCWEDVQSTRLEVLKLLVDADKKMVYRCGVSLFCPDCHVNRCSNCQPKPYS